jgi:hypothetical protein
MLGWAPKLFPGAQNCRSCGRHSFAIEIDSRTGGLSRALNAGPGPAKAHAETGFLDLEECGEMKRVDAELMGAGRCGYDIDD